MLDGRVGEPGREQLLLHVLRRGGESGRAVDAVEARELADRLERRVAVDLGMDRGRDLVGPERDRARRLLGEGDGRAENGEDDRLDSHAPSGLLFSMGRRRRADAGRIISQAATSDW